MVSVPLDYANPGGRMIELAVLRLPATGGTTRIGALLTNPGGPGASGNDFVRGAGQLIFSFELRARFDIVGFDPRGVGESSPIRCIDDATRDQLNALDPNPDTPEELEALVTGTREYDEACQRLSGDLLPFMTTENAARDMDEIRKALGEEKLTYLGFSYGTFLGGTYANLFPDRIRASVLDGAVDATLLPEPHLLEQAEGFEAALKRFLDDCAAGTDCLFDHGARTGSEFDAVMAQIEKTPLTPALLPGETREVGPGWAWTGVLGALYSRQLWPYLARALADARTGDGSVLLALADNYLERGTGGHYSNIADANNAYNCLDQVWPQDVAVVQGWARSFQRTAPRFGEFAAYGGLSCALWPVRAAKEPVPLLAKGAPPIVVVGTTGDPATPYRWSEKLAEDLESGVLLTRVGEGHTAYGAGNTCINDAVDAYLIDLKVPADGTTCE